MEKLISMVDFVLEQEETSTFDRDIENWYFTEQSKLYKIRSYAKFLRQTLTLGMFVPCDEDGVFLEEPESIHFSTEFDYKAELSVYQESKGRCLFEKLELSRETNNYYFLLNEECFTISISKKNPNTIENIIHFNLTLTPTALKQIGL